MGTKLGLAEVKTMPFCFRLLFLSHILIFLRHKENISPSGISIFGFYIYNADTLKRIITNLLWCNVCQPLYFIFINLLGSNVKKWIVTSQHVASWHVTWYSNRTPDVLRYLSWRNFINKMITSWLRVFLKLIFKNKIFEYRWFHAKSLPLPPLTLFSV